MARIPVQQQYLNAKARFDAVNAQVEAALARAGVDINGDLDRYTEVRIHVEDEFGWENACDDYCIAEGHLIAFAVHNEFSEEEQAKLIRKALEITDPFWAKQEA